ncbi:MAG: DUF92 domain-containing protein [Gemmatimonadaceae bacterium]|nr:DUF92 domain-containing protein [Gemmatimonadaceae bacterium]
MLSPAPWWLAVALAGGIAMAAWRARSLRGDGAWAAVAVGTAALCVQWAWGVYLIVWFVLASALSRYGRAQKAARLARVVEKSDRRDARQVLANGGVFAICALTALATHQRELFAVAAAGALAAAGADTWATEIGTLMGGRPWSLRTRTRVHIGTSGAVTAAGSIGSLAGASVLAIVAASTHMIAWTSLFPVLAAGVLGAFVDTAIGAWLQERRWCPSCDQETEQHRHICGTQTIPRGGLGRMDNDAVNLLATLVGAVGAPALGAILR